MVRQEEISFYLTKEIASCLAMIKKIKLTKTIKNENPYLYNTWNF